MSKLKGMFHNKRKREELPVQTAASGEKKKTGRERRCTLLVEDFFATSRLNGVMVIGNIYGKVREGDTMYLYQENRPAREVHVTTIELGPRDVVQVAKNQQVGLCLDLENVDEVSKFAVLSSVKPLEGEAANRVIENPRLFGLMMEYRRLYTNAVYMEALLVALCHTKFIIPLYIDRPPLPKGDGTFAFGEDAFVGFRPLKMEGNDSQLVFPAFTDEIATMSWKEAFHEGQPKQFATMQLPYIIGYVRQGHAGLVVNPFGPVPVYFPKELLDTVEKSEVFAKRFVKTVPVKKEEEKMLKEDTPC